jgi:dihydrodipicolinate synthase/N-acetylneuraminate lyase
MKTYKVLAPKLQKLLQDGMVIPAHPLALHNDLSFDEKRQRALTRYYIACGAGGVAVGVHTTQFEIRKPGINLLETVLKTAATEIEAASLIRPFIKVAGICGATEQAVKEAKLAVQYKYDIGLISMGVLHHSTEKELIEHTTAIAAIIPVFGYYLQPDMGGRTLSYSFWRKFAEIPNVYAIKVAAFNRYQTLDVVRAIAESDRRNDIALYTGNDDNIVADLLTPFRFMVNGQQVEKRFVGGLLGHWAVWTKCAVALLKEIKICLNNNYEGMEDLLARGVAITDMNAAIFDAANSFKGSIAGIHEVLRRQGLLEGTWCLDPHEQLSDTQSSEIDRIYKWHPELTDDIFVKTFLEKES